eukprot:5735963-Heterocapsa_arctica.AAC.1
MSSLARGPRIGHAIAARTTTGHLGSSASVADRHRPGSSTRPGSQTSLPRSNKEATEEIASTSQ